MKHRRKTPPRIPIEEFSFEYGDVNGKALIERKGKLNHKKLNEK